MRGADRLIEALEREGTEVVFGLPGGASLPIHDALEDSPIRHVLVRHEAAAGHAAEGYAKATGRVGVALVTSGPGATNLVTPIADAMADSVPTVFLTAQVSTPLRGTNAFQECDVIGVTQPIVKHSIAVESADAIAPAIHEAFHVARTGRPGPVLVDVPSDLAKAPARAATAAPSLPGYRTRTAPNGRQVRRAAEAIAAARRPVLYAGGGIVHAGGSDALRALARTHRLPVTTTLMALGCFPADDPLWLGMLGMHGTRPANWAIDEADLVVAIGARFDDRVTGEVASFAPGAKVVHLDLDAAEISKIVPAHVPVVGDARRALEAIAAELDRIAPDAGRLDPWWARLDAWRAEHGPRAAVHGERIDPEAALDALAEALDRVDAGPGGPPIVTTDVGQHQMWAANRLRFREPRRWLTSGGLGTMGFGVPAAIGAQVAMPDATVVCVTGDGSLLMHLQELATAAAERAPIKVVLLDNASLGMVRQQQDLFWGGRRTASALDDGLDWELIARGLGVAARAVEAPEELEEALAATLDEPGPALLRIDVATVDCLPMFAPGTPARAMFG
ncbi:biosynthetic-type acetolactate synthase large subunit [Patulibacter brassicae]|uniref:Acetolactate synthase n=1 Tax=Patulibacter brassicae TaxID=1705717 RepID=A0ABU4VEH5_9ACTN|nr:biosynthetic-type acetolactate synthase large subunit [Patulibacter brassicae]MDX8150119.1 biosynthetic-type acetolactate synthase large subunit [Patulibacter brassicae]